MGAFRERAHLVCLARTAASRRFDDFVPDVTCGRELLSLLRAGAIDGLSIGFRTAKARIDPHTRIRRIYVVDLWEISIVTFPMLTDARVRSVKRAPRASSRIGGPIACRPITEPPGTRSLP
jgi:uncharacterized protein